VYYSEVPELSAFYNWVPFVFPSPNLLCFSSAAHRHPCPARCAALQLCAALPIVAPPHLPPPRGLCCPPLAVPRRAVDPERLPRHPVEHAGATRQSVPGRTTALPLLHFHRVLRPYKTEPSSSFLSFPFLFPPRPPTLSRRRTVLAGICRDPFTLSKTPRPTASPPPPLVPRPDPVQPPALLRRNRLHPEPPLTGAARARPHR
jgi:hypothetical protein